MRNVCLINGSLRGKHASSLAFLKDVDRVLPDRECDKTVITVRARLKGGYSEDTLMSIARADALIFIFPLYDYGLPGALMGLLEDYFRCTRTGNEHKREAKVYVVVNCGFPRPEITGEVVRVVKNFCRRLALNWRFAVCIGAGPVVVATSKIPFLDLELKRAWADLASDIRVDADEPHPDYFIKPVIPEPILLMIKRYYERKGQMIERKHRPSHAQPTCDG